MHRSFTYSHKRKRRRGRGGGGKALPRDGGLASDQRRDHTNAPVAKSSVGNVGIAASGDEKFLKPKLCVGRERRVGKAGRREQRARQDLSFKERGEARAMRLIG